MEPKDIKTDSIKTHLRIDKKGDPTDHDKQARWKIVGDNIEGHFPCQNYFETRHTVVHVQS